MAKDSEKQLNYIQDRVDEAVSAINKVDKDLALHKAAFDEHIKQDEKMYEEFRRMNDILQANTESLKEHMHRTEVAEKRQEILEDLVMKIDARLSPFEQHKLGQEAIKKYRNEKLVKFSKFLGLIATLIAIIAGIKSI